MGQKVNPIGIRLGITREWSSKWYAGKKQFPLHVHTDFRVREFLRKKLAEATGGQSYIETVWGRGYVLRDPAPGEVERRLAIGA